jgi:hypothetical protein
MTAAKLRADLPSNLQLPTFQNDPIVFAWMIQCTTNSQDGVLGIPDSTYHGICGKETSPPQRKRTDNGLFNHFNFHDKLSNLKSARNLNWETKEDWVHSSGKA